MKDWESLISGLKCPACNNLFLPQHIEKILVRGGEAFLRCACHKCNTLSAGLIRIPPVDPPINTDDVLEAHKFLRNYAGDAYGLFNKPLPPGKQA